MKINKLLIVAIFLFSSLLTSTYAINLGNVLSIGQISANGNQYISIKVSAPGLNTVPRDVGGTLDMHQSAFILIDENNPVKAAMAWSLLQKAVGDPAWVLECGSGAFIPVIFGVDMLSWEIHK